MIALLSYDEEAVVLFNFLEEFLNASSTWSLTATLSLCSI